MKRIALTAIVGLAIAGCGASSNGAKIQQAQQQEASATTIQARLSVLPSGCSVVTVDMNGAQAYAGDAWTITNGNAVVKIESDQGTPESACLTAAKNALGW